MKQFCMYFLFFSVILIILHIFHITHVIDVTYAINANNVYEKFNNNDYRKLKDEIDEQSVIQSPWMCTPVYIKGDERMEQKYTIARKDILGRPQCARFKTEDKCTLFDDADKCNISMVNSEIIAPYTCKSGDAESSTDICKQLMHTVFQCRQNNENEFLALRKNQDDNIECLGRNPDSCSKFQTALACNKGLQEIKNDRYLECGRMMQELYGNNGYSNPNSYCFKYKDIM